MSADRGHAHRRSLVAACLVALLGLIPAEGHACGACAEDKIAATYDDGVTRKATAAGDTLVYCEVAGPLDRHRWAAATRRVAGIRAQSVRTSEQPATLSFAVDPKLQTPQGAVEATQRGLPAATRLSIVRVVETDVPRR